MADGTYSTEFGVLESWTENATVDDSTTVSEVKIDFKPSEGALDVTFKLADGGENPWRQLRVPVTPSPGWIAFVASLPQSWEAVDEMTVQADGDDE